MISYWQEMMKTSREGNGGDDTIYGGRNTDVIQGNSGDDDITGGKGNDIIEGNRGNDVVFWKSRR